MLDKPTRGKIFASVVSDTFLCNGNLLAMGKLYKLNITEQDIFYNSILLDIINQRKTDVNNRTS